MSHQGHQQQEAAQPQRIRSEKRIYIINGTRLVRAHNKAQAVHHVARQTIKAEHARQDDLVRLISDGCLIETAGEIPESE